MAGKKNREGLHNVVKKKPKTVIVTRQQVLPAETLSEIFDSSERIDLDNWNAVSRRFAKAVRHAKPLRIVQKVTLYYDVPQKVYKTVFYFEDTSQEQRSLLELRYACGYAADLLPFFFNALRFCYIDGRFTIEGVGIGREFVNGLKDVRADFLFQDSLLTLGTYDVDCLRSEKAHEVLDALCSFPSLRTLNQSTFEFVRPWTVNDGFLKSLASRGIFEVGDVRRTPFHVANGIPGGKITEDGIIDYCFGVYDDGGKGRRLHVADPQLSPQFIDKLVEACRASKSNHKLTLEVATSQGEGVQKVLANGRKVALRVSTTWVLLVKELNLRIVYRPPGQDNIQYAVYGLITCNRH